MIWLVYFLEAPERSGAEPERATLVTSAFRHAVRAAWIRYVRYQNITLGRMART